MNKKETMPERSLRNRKERTKQREREYKEIARETGVCTHCLKRESTKGYAYCIECRLWQRNYYLRTKTKTKKKKGGKK